MPESVPPPYFSTTLQPDTAVLNVARLHRPPVIPHDIIAKPRQLSSLRALGIETVEELLLHLPRRYEDQREITPVADVLGGVSGNVSMIVTLRSISYRPSKNKKLKMLQGTLWDASCGERTGGIKAIWFNQPWLLKQLKVGDWMLVRGSVKEGKQREIVVAQTEPRGGPPSGLSPFYSASEAISSSTIESIIGAHLPAAAGIVDPIDARLLAARGFPSKADAIRCVHAPRSLEEAKLCTKRLAWEELFIWSVGQAQRAQAPHQSPTMTVTDEYTQWLASLPWQLTNDQAAALEQMMTDMASERSMRRLVQGEVGSGKTLLAAAALLHTSLNGYQGVLLAPTETLARQHQQTLSNLLPPFHQPRLLTGSLTGSERQEAREDIESGSGRIFVGTHALLNDIDYQALGLVIVDEQHRFGVAQRAELVLGRDPIPHLLHLSATPIPRSLAWTVYGDLDVSILTERPGGQEIAETFIAGTPKQQQRALERAQDEVAAGRQVFIVCPAIEDNPDMPMATIETESERMAELFGNDLQIMHGKMSTSEKIAVMERFRAGEFGVLLATTVIEVGVDVHNATMMIILDAHRFGIAQLHQLRGRVGRGEHEGICILFGQTNNPRLQALRDHTDGFELAEIDLAQRGFGELLGKRQHGLSGFRIAQLPEDNDLLFDARACAIELVAADPALTDYPLLSRAETNSMSVSF